MVGIDEQPGVGASCVVAELHTRAPNHHLSQRTPDVHVPPRPGSLPLPRLGSG